MKMRKAKIKPFKGARLMAVPRQNEYDGLLDFITGMGYFLYEDPSDENCIIVSDKTLTYGDVKKAAKKFGVNLNWWNDVTDYNDRLTEELDEFVI
jgi:hypothetical protein